MGVVRSYAPSRSELAKLGDIYQVGPSSLSSRNLELALFHHQIGFSFIRGIGTMTFRFSFSRWSCVSRDFQILDGMTTSPRLERLLSLRWQETGEKPHCRCPRHSQFTQSPSQLHAALGVAFPPHLNINTPSASSSFQSRNSIPFFENHWLRSLLCVFSGDLGGNYKSLLCGWEMAPW